jgi:multiple sugar transport system ATP-binding protein
MAEVVYQHVNKVFADGSRALDDFNLHVRDGELMVLVGPSGCGKSTALRLLAGLDEPSGGRIEIGGRDTAGLQPQQRNLAMVFQNYALYPHMSVRANLAFPLKMQRMSKSKVQRRVNEVAEMLLLTPLLERRPADLSGGQRQRVAMGRAIVRQPQVFLMDEPLSNLDAILRVQIRTEIATLQKKLKTTMIYVTHDQVEAMTMGDRVAVMDQGRVQQVATPGEIYNVPANRFVAGFIGSPGMNLFDVQLRRDDEGPMISLGNSQFRLKQDAQLSPFIGAILTAGIRPEAVTVVAEGGDIELPVSTVEQLGHEQLIYCWLAEQQRHLIVRLSSERLVRAGEVLALRLERNKLFLFGPDGNTLLSASGE